ncbi:MAG: PAS domain S-box protein, partial [Acidimicrobiales bacterium]
MMRSNGANFYRMATDALAEAFAIEDVDGRLVWANNAASTMLADLTGGRRLCEGDLIREYFPQVFDEAGNACDESQTMQRLALDTNATHDNVIRGAETASGMRWFSCRSVPMSDPLTGERCVVHSLTEVTEQRRLQAELERHERHLQLALEYGPIGMAVVSGDGRFTEANPAFCRLVGWDREQLIGGPIRSITHRDDFVAVEAMARRTLSGGHESFQIEMRFVGRDGTPIPVRAVVALVGEAKGAHNFMMQCVDITAQKRVEAAQIEALRKERQLVSDLREVERLRADFVATASHELRTPLVSLLGFCELMAEELDGAASVAELRPLVESATRNGHRLQQLIDDLLAIAQIEAGGMNRRFDPVSVASLVGSVGELMAVIARREHVDLDLDVGDEVGWVIGDAEQLERVLLNIVGNAVKFTPAGGRVRLSATTSPQAMDEVVLEVEDTGIGIPLAEQDQLFTRFYRSSTAR